ncbi:MAG: flagellar assembly protein FliW [Ignavibacteriales bacterium]|nr:flagellar assembly protein FliW [Ignavibacteriales bacterium]
MKFNNHQFGEFEYDAEHVLQFPDGIIGFEGNKKFIVVNDEDSEPFRWLVSLEDSELSFPMLDPALLNAEYENVVPNGKGATIFVVASLHDDPARSSVNLRSPIVIDPASRTGRQVILDEDQFSVQYPLFAAQVQTEGV